MPWFLRRRLTGVRERMEHPGCDARKLRNTYAQFRAVNGVVSGWGRIYRRYLRPLAAAGRRLSVLDVGFGGGDDSVRLARWAARDGLDLAVTAIDTDDRALAWVRERHASSPVDFRRQTVAGLLEAGESFDVVVSNHLLHHVSAAAIAGFCSDSRRLGRELVIHSDIERSDLAWVLFAAGTTPFFHRSFIVADGLTSIRRSFTAGELRPSLPPGWRVERSFPFHRLLVHRDGGG
jgi:2-polyprenyl-3-methyl-5-hydroxy-6-metoxy-1,4-benzoquinol methylase